MPHSASPNRRQLLAGAAALTAAVPGLLRAAEPLAPDALKGRTVLITGASSGFGRVGALLYAKHGAKVIATMRNTPRPEAGSLIAEAKTDKLDLHVVEIDVTDDASVASGTAAALKIAGGRIDTLINNAGIGITGPVEVQDMEATPHLRNQCAGHPAHATRVVAADAGGEGRADLQHIVAARPRHRARRRPLFGDQIRGRSLVRTARL
jgi:NAD(P)-dependent dehydrogenase (short-subunit alcohol dehydrogenase family)